MSHRIVAEREGFEPSVRNTSYAASELAW